MRARRLSDRGAPVVLAALDPAALCPLLGAAADETLGVFERHALIHGMYGLAARHPACRMDVAALFTRLLRETDGQFLDILINDAARIDASEVQAAVDATFDDGRVDEVFVDRRDVERIRKMPVWEIPKDIEDPMRYFEGTILGAMKKRWDVSQRYKAARSLNAELAHRKLNLDAKLAHLKLRLNALLPRSVRKERKVGRNEPCPCGSGRMRTRS
jgi:Protein of unknown function (DUF1186)